ncbi:MAG: hypothetical protein RSE00_03055 [Clostridia bacterium]
MGFENVNSFFVCTNGGRNDYGKTVMLDGNQKKVFSDYKNKPNFFLFCVRKCDIVGGDFKKYETWKLNLMSNMSLIYTIEVMAQGYGTVPIAEGCLAQGIDESVIIDIPKNMEVEELKFTVFSEYNPSIDESESVLEIKVNAIELED